MRCVSQRFALALAAAVVAVAVVWVGLQGETPAAAGTYLGIADASAGVPLGESYFVAGDDEVNVLCVYDRNKPGEAVAKFDVSPHLRLARKSPEVDIEAATKLDGRVYWLSSHGTSKTGKERLNRRRLFATDFEVKAGRISMQFVGQPYRRLVDDLIQSPALAKYDFGAKSKLAPKSQGGLNIEGLATTPDGNLLVGFRSPLYEGRAIVIPLLNARQILDGQRAELGSPIELDLGGLGIRGMEYSSARGQYVIIGGPQASGPCRLFTWSGRANDSPKPVEGADLRAFNAEACLLDALNKVQVLSDDGVKDVKVDKPSFRSAWIAF